MKLSILLCLLPSLLIAQEKKSAWTDFMLKTDVLGSTAAALPGGQYYSLSGERYLEKGHSLQLTLSYAYYPLQTSYGARNRKDTYWSVRPEYKYYFKRTDHGLYVSPNVSYLLFSHWARESFPDNRTIAYKQDIVGSGFNLGYQNYLFKYLVYDAFAGIGYRYRFTPRSLKVNSSRPFYQYYESEGEYYWSLGLNLGYRF